MESIASGVHTLPLEFESERGSRTFHLAAVETETGLILLDTGYPSHADLLESHLNEGGFDFDDVELVVITHQDLDHAGALEDVTERTGAITLAHADDVPYIAGELDNLKGSEYPFVQVDVELADGVVFRTAAGKMRVVATPGHTPGHISLYFPDEKLLLAGDAITAEESFDGPNEDATLDMETAIESIGRLAELDVERTLCFHGGAVDHDAERIRSIHENLVDTWDRA